MYQEPFQGCHTRSYSNLLEPVPESSFLNFGYKPLPLESSITPNTKNAIMNSKISNSIAFVILGAWRRPSVIERIIEACLNQVDVVPTEIFVSSFASPTENEYDQIMMKYANHSIVRYLKGKPQLLYWGRFQQMLSITSAR
eukprot:TRINITY_DN1575_c0_g1_i4.p1 TRINITY_DN1575_c0_g1~~TRINITY_DN1575_c0_g1_i4.p1  ORF type:complete len:141 (-),score=36.91 TRINITY_DN1575_c0_g1_i4:290-712(-)